MGVLEIVNGKDEWIESTQNQVRRLDSLIRDLIELAKSEEMGKAGELRVFNVSEAARNAADTFRTSAQAQGKQLETAIEPELYMKGQQEAILRLLTVLLDNAVKYCDDGGTVRLTAEKERAARLMLRVCQSLSDLELPSCRACLTVFTGSTAHAPVRAGATASACPLPGR